MPARPRTPRVLAILLLLAGAGIVAALLTQITGQPPAPITPTVAEAGPDPAPPAAPAAPAPHEDASTAPGREDAREVAKDLFDWDTLEDHHAEVIQRVLGHAEPPGADTAGLAADLNGYLPTPHQWRALRTHQTRQHLVIDQLSQPSSWPDIVATADALPPSVTAITVTGTRHRAGLVNGQPEQTAHPVAFTIFLDCPTGPDGCHLLRLSHPDRPLD